MNKILRYSFIALLAFICDFAFAGETTIDFTKLTVTKTGDGYTLKSGDFTFTAVKNNGGTAPTQNSNSKDLRHYAKNTLTITGAKMTKIVFAMSDAGLKQWADITASEGKITIDKDAKTTTWENATGSTAITLTVGDENKYGTKADKKAGQFDISSVVITSDGQGGGETPTPPAEETTKAENIAAFKALGSGTTAILTLTNAQVVYKNEYTTKSGTTNTEYYIRDVSGAIQFFNTGLDLKVNQILNGTVEVKYSPYNDMPEAAKSTNTSAEKLTITDGEAAVPTKVTVADLATDKYLCDLVTVENVNITTEKEDTYTNNYLVSGDDKVMIYDKFKTNVTISEGEGYDVTGVLVTAKLSGKIVKELAPISAPVATGINHISAAVDSADAPVYNLAGQRVGKNAKGVLIKNGKKYVVK